MFYTYTLSFTFVVPKSETCLRKRKIQSIAIRHRTTNSGHIFIDQKQITDLQEPPTKNNPIQSYELRQFLTISNRTFATSCKRCMKTETHLYLHPEIFISGAHTGLTPENMVNLLVSTESTALVTISLISFRI